MEREHWIEPEEGDALLVVDLQIDFLPGGALPVRDSDGLIDAINRHLATFECKALPVVATRDWHPTDHCSFRTEGGPWPPHCIAGSEGAAFPKEARLPQTVLVVDKATSRERDAYSGFDRTGLTETLRELGVRRVFVVGLATDYCVKATTLDALEAGFEVVLLEDGIRAVDASAGDGERALREMHRRGATSARLTHGAA